MAQEATSGNQKGRNHHPQQRGGPARNRISGNGVVRLEGKGLDGFHSEERKNQRAIQLIQTGQCALS